MISGFRLEFQKVWFSTYWDQYFQHLLWPVFPILWPVFPIPTLAGVFYTYFGRCFPILTLAGVFGTSTDAVNAVDRSRGTMD